jgi:hypothetical protein
LVQPTQSNLLGSDIEADEDLFAKVQEIVKKMGASSRIKFTYRLGDSSVQVRFDSVLGINIFFANLDKL